jgi:pimeloyl-ACP methyl ester carboxylesterase
MVHANPKIARLYARVAPEMLQKLLDFRQRYPYQFLEAGGQAWRFIDSATPEMEAGGPPVLMLTGATTVAEVSFQSIAHFAGQHRVIAPDYPPLKSLKELFTALMALLDRLGVGTFDLMGGSYGGWIAQSLVRMVPQRVRRMVLAAIGPPNPENSRQLARMLPLFRWVPMGILRGMINRSFSRLDTSLTEYPEMALLWALTSEVLETRLQRGDLLALLERLIDQTRNYTFSPRDLQNWPGKILMVFGSEDPASTLEKRQAMQALYPQAEMVVFEGGQHGIALTHQAQYFAAIEKFLSD